MGQKIDCLFFDLGRSKSVKSTFLGPWWSKIKNLNIFRICIKKYVYKFWFKKKLLTPTHLFNIKGEKTGSQKGEFCENPERDRIYRLVFKNHWRKALEMTVQFYRFRSQFRDTGPWSWPILNNFWHFLAIFA